MNKKLLLIIIIFFNVIGYCQNNIESALNALRHYDLQTAKKNVSTIANQEIKELLKSQIRYYENGILDSLEIDTYSNSSFDNRINAIKNLLIADQYSLLRETSQNKIIFKKYFTALDLSRKLKDTFLISEALRKINLHILYRSRDSLMSKDFLEQYQKVSDKSKFDTFWYNYISIGYIFMITEGNVESADDSYMNTLFDNAFLAVDDESFLTATLQQLKGIYLSHWKENYIDANALNLKALQIYKNIPFWYAESKLKGLEYNTSINYYKNGQYRKAIPFFLKDLNRNKEPIYLMHTNEWLFKCYEGLKKYDSTHYYFKKMTALKDKMKQSENAVRIREFSTKYDFANKEKELAQLAQEKTSIQNKFFTLLPVLGIVTLISIIIFFLYRRYKNKSVVLQEEKSETLQKLDELKSIVIKNHIILKDKTKVYISDLMYVKSDDHYLNIFTSDDKSHFVRGKLSNIRQELPPNFIQCHRSYIVNSNFIKRVNSDSITLIDKTQIPLSRSYRSKF